MKYVVWCEQLDSVIWTQL